MIYARLEELSRYLRPEIYDKIKEFLQQVHQDMPEGKYQIIGNEVYARVMSYSTGNPEDCKIEAHNKYIDIQATITGAEGISVFARNNLQENSTYNSEEDVIFFEKVGAVENAHTTNVPGYFTLLYPEDAHRPQERAGDMEWVKKFVIKVAV